MVKEYLKEQGLSYCEDSTNASEHYTRNRLRHQVLPVLEELNPQVLEAVSRMVGTLSQDESFLEEQASSLLQEARVPWGLDAALLGASHRAVQTRALRLFCREQGVPPLEKQHVDALCCCLAQGGETGLPGGFLAQCSQGVFSLKKMGEAGETEGFSQEVALGKTDLPCGKTLFLQVKPLSQGENSPKIHNLLFKNALDYDIITGNLKARSRREGDRFSPAGRRITKSLKGLFQENRIPLAQRDRTVLLEWEGRLVFCEGVGPAEGFQPTERTRRLLAVEIREGKKA